MKRIRYRQAYERQKIKTQRLNLLIDPLLKDWIQDFARRHHTTVTQIVIAHLVRLKASEMDIDVEQI